MFVGVAFKDMNIADHELAGFFCVCVLSHTHTRIGLCMDVHVSDYGYDNGWLVKERDNGYVDDGNDECFTKMMMIITIVVFVLHPSVID